MTKWIENFVSASKYGKTDVCPYCNSKNTDYVFVKLEAAMNCGGGGFIEVWCNDCKRKEHMSCRGELKLDDKVRKVISEDEYEISVLIKRKRNDLDGF